MNFTGPRGMPTSTSIMITPPMPAFFSASKSAVMPSRVRLPSMMNQYTHGRADSGGLRKPFSRSAPRPAAMANRGQSKDQQDEVEQM